MHKACPTVLCHRLHQPPVWASVKASFLSMVARKPADRCWAYLSSSVIIYKRFTAGTQREVQVPLSRPNSAQFFSREKTQLCSHSWMWVRTEPESPGPSPREEQCQAATPWPMSSSTVIFCFCKSREFFSKGDFAKHLPCAQLTHEAHFIN